MFTEERIDEIGLALEEGGMSHSDIDEYFEHAGVKGMKWGQRRARQKVGLVAGAYGGATVGSLLSTAATRGQPSLLGPVLSVAGGVLGYKATKRFIDRKGDTRISDLPDLPDYIKKDIKKP